ncbi:c2h2 zinc finger protein [Diplodia corticola]|uniref:C2h2 zinc finger protein n=1 Tax=Diplodia corticola TaxID=236234 RepID=A0A1J9RXQ1_9PEZI|nr:c2h2 zinc finger protein [Diplodia corticola]OJD33135.1 c2h2 zinc finger protein [Diplodia corticola]
MGNNSSREGRPGTSLGHSRSHDGHSHGSQQGAQNQSGDRMYSSRSGRSSRPDLSFLGINTSSDRDPPEFTRRETRAEREARKREKERILREQERERSVREEGVDGGYLVTLGTYTGPEDFSKSTVRQLMIERRVAPFWKGLNDHEDTWTEAQLVCIVNDRPLPAPDEPLPADLEPARTADSKNPKSSEQSLNGLMVPITGRTPSSTSDASGRLSPGQSAFSLPSATSPLGNTSSSSPFFRGRAKTLAALTTSSKNNSQTDMTPQEVMLPKDPYVNGQRLEAFLYKDASECPICFLYYPPYLNMTRCCDQPICSECFVQIKRPDPHPPEHHDPNDPNAPPPSTEPQDDCMLVSEPAACPFCKQPEFGVTYEAPPFRKGLAYQGQTIQPSAMSSASSLAAPTSTEGGGGRKRGKSLSANSPQVITTDMVRPDWAKKLADARAHALRRSAAATALHNAAYVIGNNSSDSRGFTLGRRRRNLLSNDSPNSSGTGTPRNGSSDPLTQLLGSAGRERGSESQQQDSSGRHGSRRSRMEDLEELMMMEAIRLSLAAEEERKRKEEKEADKKAKKEEKKKAKEEKKAQKYGRKTGFFPVDVPEDAPQPGPSAQGDSKGKSIDRSGAGFNPMCEPTSTLNTGASSSARADPQKHLEESRARIQKPSDSVGPASPLDLTGQTSHRMALRQLSNASSSASSLAESEEADSLRQNGQDVNSGSSFEPSPNNSGLSLGGGASASDPHVGSDTPPGGGAGTEPMFNFRSLAAVIGNEDEREKSQTEHLEDIGPSTPSPNNEKSSHEAMRAGDGAAASTIPTLSPAAAADGNVTRSRGDSGESSSSSAPPPVFITPASPPPDGKAPWLPMPDFGDNELDQKSVGDVQIDERQQEHEHQRQRHETDSH